MNCNRKSTDAHHCRTEPSDPRSRADVHHYNPWIQHGFIYRPIWECLLILHISFDLIHSLINHASFVEFMYLVFMDMPGESYGRRLGSLLRLRYAFQAPTNSLVGWVVLCRQAPQWICTCPPFTAADRGCLALGTLSVLARRQAVHCSPTLIVSLFWFVFFFFLFSFFPVPGWLCLLLSNCMFVVTVC